MQLYADEVLLLIPVWHLSPKPCGLFPLWLPPAHRGRHGDRGYQLDLRLQEVRGGYRDHVREETTPVLEDLLEGCHSAHYTGEQDLTLTVLVATIDAQWEGMGV